MSKKAVKPVQVKADEVQHQVHFHMGVYILHYQNDEMTNRCVQAFQEATQYFEPQGLRIVVIDNGSPVPYVAPHGVYEYRLDTNLPVVEAWNRGMQSHTANFYFCANNDAFPALDCLQKLVSALDDPTVGIVAAGTSDETVGMMHVPYPNELPNLYMNHVDGHLWGWRQELVDAIGYPDADGHTHQMCWASNKDYCWRARQAGFRVVCVRSAFVDHQHHETYDRAKADAAGHAWLAQKWGELAPLVEA